MFLQSVMMYNEVGDAIAVQNPLGPFTNMDCFIPSMDDYIDYKVRVEILYLFQTSTVHYWSTGMDKWFHLILYNECNYLSILKLTHVNTKGAPGNCLLSKDIFSYSIKSICLTYQSLTKGMPFHSQHFEKPFSEKIFESALKQKCVT